MKESTHRIVSLSRSTQYAVLALHSLAFCGRDRYRLPEIADCSGVPPAFLSKVLVALRDAGFVDAKRGAHGGYVLTRSPHHIDLLSVADAIETKSGSSGFVIPAGLAGILDQADGLVRDALARMTIADLSPPATLIATNNASKHPGPPGQKLDPTSNPTRRSK